MALTRKMLKGMALTDEQIDTIIEAHTETTEALKHEREQYKADSDRLKEVTKELETFKSGDNWESKYNELSAEYTKYKTDTEKAAAHAGKKTAFNDLLKAIGISDKYINSVLNVQDIDGIELDKDGSIKGADKLTDTIKSNYGAFIAETRTTGEATPTPPAGTSGAMTRDKIMQISDRAERRAAIKANPEAFNN